MSCLIVTVRTKPYAFYNRIDLERYHKMLSRTTLKKTLHQNSSSKYDGSWHSNHAPRKMGTAVHITFHSSFAPILTYCHQFHLWEIELFLNQTYTFKIKGRKMLIVSHTLLSSDFTSTMNRISRRISKPFLISPWPRHNATTSAINIGQDILSMIES